jgi:hypothetical protein
MVLGATPMFSAGSAPVTSQKLTVTCAMALFSPYAMMIDNLTKDHKYDNTKQYVAGPEKDKIGDHADVANGVVNLVAIHNHEY